MRVINKLTSPGGIRRVDLLPDSVRIETVSGEDRLYRLASVVGDGNNSTAKVATNGIVRSEGGTKNGAV